MKIWNETVSKILDSSPSFPYELRITESPSDPSRIAREFPLEKTSHLVTLLYFTLLYFTLLDFTLLYFTLLYLT